MFGIACRNCLSAYFVAYQIFRIAVAFWRRQTLHCLFELYLEGDWMLIFPTYGTYNSILCIYWYIFMQMANTPLLAFCMKKVETVYCVCLFQFIWNIFAIAFGLLYETLLYSRYHFELMWSWKMNPLIYTVNIDWWLFIL